MKGIEIPTAHNIVITHELATVTQRILAFMIDAIILSVYSGLVAAIAGDNMAILYIGIVLVLVFYHLVWEVFNRGQSPGKMALKIRVVSMKGMSPSLSTFILRWAFRPLDISLTVGTMAILAIIVSSKSQRIGDLLGRATVIQLDPSTHISLDQIQQLDQAKADIRYPMIRQYSDQDMLLVKQTLRRFTSDNNEANQKMVIDLAKRISTDLEINLEGKSPVDFLRKVLSDYILLTR